MFRPWGIFNASLSLLLSAQATAKPLYASVGPVGQSVFFNGNSGTSLHWGAGAYVDFRLKYWLGRSLPTVFFEPAVGTTFAVTSSGSEVQRLLTPTIGADIRMSFLVVGANAGFNVSRFVTGNAGNASFFDFGVRLGAFVSGTRNRNQGWLFLANWRRGFGRIGGIMMAIDQATLSIGYQFRLFGGLN